MSGLFDKIQGCELPVVSYQVGEVVYDSFSQDAPIRLTYEAVPYEYGLKGKINNIMQMAMFEISKLLPKNVAIENIKIIGNGNYAEALANEIKEYAMQNYSNTNLNISIMEA